MHHGLILKESRCEEDGNGFEKERRLLILDITEKKTRRDQTLFWVKKPVRFGVKTKMMRPGDLKFSHSTWKSQEGDGKAKTTMTWSSPFHPLPATSPLTRGQQHPNAQSFVRIPVFCSLAPYCLRFQAIWFWYVINLSAKPLFICIHQDLKLWCLFPPLCRRREIRCEDFPVISFLFPSKKEFCAAAQLSSGLWVGEEGQAIARVPAWFTSRH